MDIVTAYIYLVEDGFGQKASAVCEDNSDNIQIMGIQNSGEEKLYFEASAYHLQDWCENNGLKYRFITKKYDFDQLWSGN